MKEIRATATTSSGEKMLFLCAGEKDCKKSKHCFLNGGKCRHTQDIKASKHFKQSRTGSFVEDDPDRQCVKGQQALNVPVDNLLK